MLHPQPRWASHWARRAARLKHSHQDNFPLLKEMAFCWLLFCAGGRVRFPKMILLVKDLGFSSSGETGERSHFPRCHFIEAVL